ncbi:MAG: hypothetical protein IT300_15205 [Dehalococcoidia bacterium]|nr:hypothetical protein [Dehalococcoidia bacterium]
MVAPIKRKEERGKRKEERGKRKEERGKRSEKRGARKEEGEKSGERQGSPALSGASHRVRLRRRS